jgi:hypothetical protein
MLGKAREYQEYARECVRMAQEADSEETRDRLLEIAKVWMDAALIEVDEEGHDQDGSVLLAAAASIKRNKQ